jgi:hypothetical protein
MQSFRKDQETQELCRRRNESHLASENIAKKHVQLNEARMTLVEEACAVAHEKERLQLMKQRREALSTRLLSQNILKASVMEDHERILKVNEYWRWKRVSDVFSAIPIEAGSSAMSGSAELKHPGGPAGINQQQSAKSKAKQSVPLKGCCTILGFPLQNSGNYQGAPHEIVSSALGLIAHVVDAVSALLNIPLDHPLHPFDTYECIISPQGDQRRVCILSPAVRHSSSYQHEWESFVQSLAKNNNDANKTGKDSINANSKMKKLAKAKAQVTSSRLQADEGDWSPNPDFPFALSLLQANIVCLCFRAGVAPVGIWPAQGMLLNLSALADYVRARVESFDRNGIDYHTDVYSAIPSIMEVSKCDAKVPNLSHRYRNNRLESMIKSAGDRPFTNENDDMNDDTDAGQQCTKDSQSSVHSMGYSYAYVDPHVPSVTQGQTYGDGNNSHVENPQRMREEKCAEILSRMDDIPGGMSESTDSIAMQSDRHVLNMLERNLKSPSPSTSPLTMSATGGIDIHTGSSHVFIDGKNDHINLSPSTLPQEDMRIGVDSPVFVESKNAPARRKKETDWHVIK